MTTITSPLKISELADQAGVKVSTVRFYERIGLVPEPGRSRSGYRLYDPDAQARLRFIARARRLGLSLEQIAELLAVWNGDNCATTRDHVARMLDENLADIRARVAELEAFADDLERVRHELEADNAPAVCEPELGCCTPDASAPVPVALTMTRETRERVR